MSEPEYLTYVRIRKRRWGPEKTSELEFTTRGERVAGVLLTTRRARYLRGFLQAVGEGLTGEAALLRGGQVAGMRGKTPVGELEIVRRMERFLADPDVQQAVRNVYEAKNFTLEDAVDMHVKHIRGEVTREEMAKDGSVVEVKLAPSYPALKDWLAVATPREPKRVNVLTARVGIAREVRTDGSPPPMASRAIGEILDG